MGRTQEVVFWLLLGQGVALLLLDTYVRRLPGESYWHAALFINQRDMSWGTWVSGILSLVLAVVVLDSSAWAGLGGALPAPIAAWWLLSSRSPRNRAAVLRQQLWPEVASEPSSNVHLRE
jgi:hypothetical protein